MAKNKTAVSVVENRIKAMQAGFQKDFTPKQSLVVGGVTMLQPAILAQLASDLALYTNADDARTALAGAVAAKKAGGPGVVSFLDELDSVLKSTFGPGGAQLPDFGIKPPKARKVLTVEEKAVAVAAANGTKKVRGIMGANERAKITTQGKPGLALVSPTGNVVPSSLSGPTPPGSGTPVAVTVTTVAAGGGSAGTGSTASPGTPAATNGATGGSAPAAGPGNGQ